MNDNLQIYRYLRTGQRGNSMHALAGLEKSGRILQ